MDQIQGIVLRRVDYKENAVILTLFTANLGVISAMLRGKNWIQKACLLSLLECNLRKGSGSWYFINDFYILDPYLKIRENYDKLHFAGKILKLLLETQQQDKAAPLLFALTKSYLHRLKETLAPSHIYHSFIVKLLLHEGLYTRREMLFPFETSKEERQCITVLGETKSFELLEAIELPEGLPKKLEIFAKDSLL